MGAKEPQDIAHRVSSLQLAALLAQQWRSGVRPWDGEPMADDLRRRFRQAIRLRAMHWRHGAAFAAPKKFQGRSTTTGPDSKTKTINSKQSWL